MTKETKSQSAEGENPKTGGAARGLIDLWQKIYDAQERAFTAAIDKLSGTAAFAGASGKVLEGTLAAQRVMRESVRGYLETINMPTREDIARLGELMLGVEEKIDQLDERLARIEAQLGAERTPSAPPSSNTPRRGKRQAEE